MLTKEQKEKHVSWMMKHKNDDRNRTVLSDELYSEIQSAAGRKLHERS